MKPLNPDSSRVDLGGLDFNVKRALMIIAYLYGWGAAVKVAELKPEVAYNPVLKRVKHVKAGGRVLFSIRASDGLLIPTIDGARLVDSRIVVSREAAKFASEGRNIPAKAIKGVVNVVQNMDAAVVDEDGNIVAVGRLLVSPGELNGLSRGFVVKVRHHVKRDAKS